MSNLLSRSVLEFLSQNEVIIVNFRIYYVILGSRAAATWRLVHSWQQYPLLHSPRRRSPRHASHWRWTKGPRWRRRPWSRPWTRQANARCSTWPRTRSWRWTWSRWRRIPTIGFFGLQIFRNFFVKFWIIFQPLIDLMLSTVIWMASRRAGVKSHYFHVYPFSCYCQKNCVKNLIFQNI